MSVVIVSGLILRILEWVLWHVFHRKIFAQDLQVSWTFVKLLIAPLILKWLLARGEKWRKRKKDSQRRTGFFKTSRK